MKRNTVADIRAEFVRLKNAEEYVIDKSGSKMLEIVGATFIADEEAAFGEVSWNYVEREIEWYESMSLNVNDIPGKTPAIWTQVADPDGFINSNYGWCIYSLDNFLQYDNVLEELQEKPESRRAVMIYTRPNMWSDYNRYGRSDFMCTNAVQYVIREGVLDCIVQMRSNDLWAGYRNDRAWQDYVLGNLSKDLGVPKGKIHWQVGSLHVYEAQFYLIDHYQKTGETHITKKEYTEKYLPT